jgi:hypothetical protein
MGGRKKCHEQSIAKDIQGQGRISPEYAMRPQNSAALRAIGAAASHAQAAVPARAVNLSLSIVWRRAANFAKQGKVPV